MASYAQFGYNYPTANQVRVRCVCFLFVALDCVTVDLKASLYIRCASKIVSNRYFALNRKLCSEYNSEFPCNFRDKLFIGRRRLNQLGSM